jgi:FixJ family two-component response regulator
VANDRSLIAVVDDDESVRLAIKRLIRSAGLRAEAFSSAEEFLCSPYRDLTACIVADINMPGMSGTDLHGHLLTTNCPIPVILITAYPSERMRAYARSIGTVCYLTKPFSDEDLLRHIRCAIGQAGEGCAV